MAYLGAYGANELSRAGVSEDPKDAAGLEHPHMTIPTTYLKTDHVIAEPVALMSSRPAA